MELLINIVLKVLLYSIIGLSVKTVYSLVNFFDFSFGIFIIVGSYITYFISIQLQLPMIIAIPISVIFCIGLILIVNQFIYKPIKKRKAKNWQLLIVSLGVYVIIQNLISIIWGNSTLSFRTWEIKAGHQILGAYTTDIQIITIISCSVLLVLSWLFIEKTNIGQQIKAVSSNPQLSSYYGISKNKTTIYSYILGSGLVACAGILIAADTDMTPTMGFNWLLYGVVAMIIGGMGKIRYLLLGALLLATAQHLSAYYLDSKWMNATAYIILIIFLYFKPYGFSGQKLKKQEV